MSKSRDDFSEKTKLQIAKRAGWLCSFPSCRTLTIGSTADGKGEINIGTAAHICAAAPGGPRYDESMSPDDRSSANNGIWMCRDHGKAIDSDVKEFTVERLREWKKQAQEDSWRRVLRNESLPESAVILSDLNVRLHRAATADLAVFRNKAKWPRTSVALTLKVEDHSESATTTILASAVRALDDLILVAPPGMGKTTTLFQIAEGILNSNSGIPIVVTLGDWAAENISIIASILNRPAFNQLSEADFRRAATKSGVVLLLDGWNELDANARGRARTQIESIKAEILGIGLVISTRKQVLDVPFSGKLVELMPLNEEQQMAIAKAICGEGGIKIVDYAWRTSGVRELVNIPLYLTALLALPDDAPFPTTKEEVLRRFVEAHEKDPRCAEVLNATVKGFQHDFLINLAVFATKSASTAISDKNARSSISETGSSLVTNGQTTAKPEPNDVLDALINNHILMRAGDTSGVSFQHQQFQEWYASHMVEQWIGADIDNVAKREKLKAEIFNLPVWEESILFAVERIARGDAHQKVTCAKAIMAAFEVDPMLAAEMIYRATNEVWGIIAKDIQEKVELWHTPEKCDRAFRFMMNSGRPEFLDKIWPLITHENEQISLNAIRNCRRFRPSILGAKAVQNIKKLPSRPREVLLNEIASNGTKEGLDLATLVARDDPDQKVQVSIIDALAFRRADRHIADILKSAKGETYDLLVRRGLENIGDPDILQRLAEARQRVTKNGISAYEQLQAILNAESSEDHSAELKKIISEMEIEKVNDAAVHLVYQLRDLYPKAIAEGILERVLKGRALFYGADDILAAANLTLDDDPLFQIAISQTTRGDRPEAASSALGPRSAGKMIDRLLAIGKQIRNPEGSYNHPIANIYNDIQRRIAHVPAGSLISAIQERSGGADNEQIACFAELLSRHPNDESDRGRPFTEKDRESVRVLIEDWGNRLLNSADARRRHFAQIATLASHVPDVSLLPILKRLLDENLQRYSAFRQQAAAEGWQGKAADEARAPMTEEYKRAFIAIATPETTALMYEYLANSQFGEEAAVVLKAQWIYANEPSLDTRFLGGVDFRLVREKRAAFAINPDITSAEADGIFSVVENLLGEDANDEQKELAGKLGTVGSRLPHGQRNALINKLIDQLPRQGRYRLFLNLILSGAEVDTQYIANGIADTFEAAKKDTWILTQGDGYELREWLQLLPYTNNPEQILEIVRNLPTDQRNPKILESIVRGLDETPSKNAEEVLFKLAEEDPRFYENHTWRDTALKLGTLSSALRIIDLTASGVLDSTRLDSWHWSRQLAALIAEFPEVRKYVYSLLAKQPISKSTGILLRAVSEAPDVEGLLLLVSIESKYRMSVLNRHTIQIAVTENIPIEGWKNAYNIVPIAVPELRQKLLAMGTDVAIRCLNTIDRIRDEYGMPLSESRHPDLGSGKSWPIMASGSYA